jgi:hypothetical protein
VTDRHTGSIDILIPTDTESAGTIDIVLIPIGKRPIDKLLAIDLFTEPNQLDVCFPGRFETDRHTTTEGRIVGIRNRNEIDCTTTEAGEPKSRQLNYSYSQTEFHHEQQQ